MLRIIMMAGLMLAALAFPALPSLAKEPIGHLAGGRCQTLTIANDKLTSSCGDAVIFAIVKGKGVIVVPLKPFGSFAFYLDRPIPGKANLIAVEVSAFPVAKKHFAVAVAGTCSVGDYLKGRASITCTAKDINGLRYKLDFRTARITRQ